jgi:O-antigen/teichoic acid export membrane protein
VAAGTGFAVAGLTIYAFLAISARALGPDRYASLSVLWAITFLAAPGFYYPIEQEVARALSERRARGVGSGPVVRRAALLGLGLALLLSVLALAASAPLLDAFFHDEAVLLVAFLGALAAYAAAHLLRGVLAGSNRFGSYGLLVGTEGVARLTGAVVLGVAGFETAGPFGLVVALSPLVAVLAVSARERHSEVLEPGPEAPWSELTRAFGYLLVGSVLAQAMINVTPLVVNVLASRDERELVGKVLIALIVARIPVFMFQAVQASLIPQLAGLAAEGKDAEFRHRLLRLMTALAGTVGVFTAAAMAFGPPVIRLFFGREFELGAGHLGYLAAASGAYMLALALAQALIAVAGYRRVAFGWVIGMTVLFAATALPSDDVLFRAERGFLAGALAATTAMSVLLARRLHRGLRAAQAEPSAPAAGEIFSP